MENVWSDMPQLPHFESMMKASNYISDILMKIQDHYAINMHILLIAVLKLCGVTWFKFVLGENVHVFNLHGSSFSYQSPSFTSDVNVSLKDLEPIVQARTVEFQMTAKQAAVKKR